MRYSINSLRGMSGLLALMLSMLALWPLSTFGNSYAQQKSQTLTTRTISQSRLLNESKTPTKELLQARALQPLSSGRLKRFTNSIVCAIQHLSEMSHQSNSDSVGQTREASSSLKSSTPSTSANLLTTAMKDSANFSEMPITKKAQPSSDVKHLKSLKTFAEPQARSSRTSMTAQSKRLCRLLSSACGIGRTSALSARRRLSWRESSPLSMPGRQRFAARLMGSKSASEWRRLQSSG